ncbi:hypothetical protein [Candidatus Blastococcus massiliensis]|uniref:hypothetical protein n=1 Tax=Candidatus Blastococcus massiliensis TaxID=1470358 RepID=UPI0004BAABBF|nr:hypothetical protein [Candidatus Blastococcus massiliensis]
MTTPQHEPTTGDAVADPTVSTAPTSATEAPPPASRWWTWDNLPDHLGRARTSTVFLSVLFLAVFTLYLNVRPDPDPVGTRPSGGNTDVEAPVEPSEPSEPAAPETTSGPEPTEDPDEETGTPTTSRPPGPTSPDSDTSEPDEPTETSEPTGGTTGPGGSAPSSPPAP